MVSFAHAAVVGVAPTEDRTLVTTALDTLKPGEGTAIGDAVALSFASASRVGRPPRRRPRIVLISDGARDGGQVDPGDAAQQAKRRGVPVYSVLSGPGRSRRGGADGRFPQNHSRATEPGDARAGREDVRR